MLARTAGEGAPLLQGSDEALLRVEGLTVDFGGVRVVDDVSFELMRGRTLGLVGESGSGKSVTARAILGLVATGGRIAAGSVHFQNRDLVRATRHELREIRGRDIAMIFQEPRRALDPSFKIGTQIAAVARRHLGLGKAQAWKHATQLLSEMRIPQAALRMHDYPHQFSGGMCQRVMLAMALVASPKVLIADEPTTALDVSVQARILELIREIQVERDLSVLFISHDLGVIAEMCDEVAVMYAGHLVERAAVESIFGHPRHPYTQALLDSLPQRGVGRFHQIRGTIPMPGEWPSGCRFAPRCDFAEPRCSAPERVALVEAADRHLARCVRTAELDLEGVE